MNPYYYKPSEPYSFGRKTNKLPPEWWRQSRTYSLHKPIRHRFPTRATITSAPHIQYQADLIEMIPYARENRGYRYILVIIDIFTRYCWVSPLKSKTGEELAHVFKKIFQSEAPPPMYLQTDQGKEFYNTHVRRVLTKLKIHLFSTKSPFKASMAERVNRTLKSKLWRYFTYSGKYKWLAVLPQLTESYNNTPHRSLPNRLTPSMANDKERWFTIWQHQQYEGVEKRVFKPHKFSIGDWVRVSRWKGL